MDQDNFYIGFQMPDNQIQARMDLLQLASKAPQPDWDALRLSATVTSDEQADTLLREATTREAQRTQLLRRLCGACAVTVLAYIGYASLFEDPGLSSYALLGIGVSLFFLLMQVRLSRDEAKSLQRLLTPITGTVYCLTALELVKHGSVTVNQWRDQALSQRHVLRVMDVMVMQALWTVIRQQGEFKRNAAELHRHEAEQQAKYAAACREVHGIDASAQ